MGAMEDVCAYVLARLVRSGTAKVAPGAPAWLLLSRRMRDAIAREPASPHTALERVAQEARSRLTGLMPDPPDCDPVGQLLLLRAAVAARPDLWRGLCFMPPASSDGLAEAMDLPTGSIPHVYLQRLACDHAAFAALADSATPPAPPASARRHRSARIPPAAARG